MTTKRSQSVDVHVDVLVHVHVLVLGFCFFLFSCSGPTRARRPDGLDVSSYPTEIQQAYGVFEYRCSRCHSLARPLNAQIESPEFWGDYVERMRRMPGSGINPQDAQTILKFLVYYTEHRDSRGSERVRWYANRRDARSGR